MAIKLYEKSESLKLAINLVKDAKEITYGKMGMKIINRISNFVVVDEINGSLTTGGGVNFINVDQLALKVSINVNLIAAYIENEGIEKARKMAIKFVRHECFHVYQYVYIWTRGGKEALKKAVLNLQKMQYGEDPLERGAHAYEDPDNAKLQDLSKEFAFCF